MVVHAILLTFAVSKDLCGLPLHECQDLAVNANDTNVWVLLEPRIVHLITNEEHCDVVEIDGEVVDSRGLPRLPRWRQERRVAMLTIVFMMLKDTPQFFALAKINSPHTWFGLFLATAKGKIM